MAPPQVGDEQFTKEMSERARLVASEVYSKTDPFPDWRLMFVKLVSVKVNEVGLRAIRGVLVVVYVAVDLIRMELRTIVAESPRERSEEEDANGYAMLSVNVLRTSVPLSTLKRNL